MRKRFRKFFKEWWDTLGELEKEEERNLYSPPPSPRDKDTSCWCPFYGYTGSADEVRCHLLNRYRQ